MFEVDVTWVCDVCGARSRVVELAGGPTHMDVVGELDVVLEEAKKAGKLEKVLRDGWEALCGGCAEAMESALDVRRGLKGAGEEGEGDLRSVGARGRETFAQQGDGDACGADGIDGISGLTGGEGDGAGEQDGDLRSRGVRGQETRAQQGQHAAQGGIDGAGADTGEDVRCIARRVTSEFSRGEVAGRCSDCGMETRFVHLGCMRKVCAHCRRLHVTGCHLDLWAGPHGPGGGARAKVDAEDGHGARPQQEGDLRSMGARGRETFAQQVAEDTQGGADVAGAGSSGSTSCPNSALSRGPSGKFEHATQDEAGCDLDETVREAV